MFCLCFLGNLWESAQISFFINSSIPELHSITAYLLLHLAKTGNHNTPPHPSMTPSPHLPLPDPLRSRWGHFLFQELTKSSVEQVDPYRNHPSRQDRAEITRQVGYQPNLSSMCSVSVGLGVPRWYQSRPGKTLWNKTGAKGSGFVSAVHFIHQTYWYLRLCR